MTTTRSNLGPLTTEFKYPSSCQVVVPRCRTCTEGWQAQACGDNSHNNQGVQDNPDCWPTRDSNGESISTGVALNGWGFYSPGLSCPQGYETKCLATASVDGGADFQFPLTKGETAVGCCPTGFRCLYNSGVNIAQTCYRIASDGSYPTVQCSSGTSNGFSYHSMPATVTETVSGKTTKSVLASMTIYAPLFQLMHQSTDLSSSSEITESGSVAAATSTNGSSDNSSSSEGLSTGAQAGIGVGAALGGLALIGAAAFFFLKRRKRMTPIPHDEPVSEQLKQDSEQLKQELAAPAPPAELYGATSRSELA